MPVIGFYAQQKLFCGDTVETQYYNTYAGTKGGRIVTRWVSYVCYFDENIVDKVETLTQPEVVGKHPLPLCRNFFDMNIKCPTTRWCGNSQHNRKKKKQSKKMNLETLVPKENQKGRKLTWIFWHRILQCILGYIIHSVLGFSVKYNLYVMGCIILYCIYKLNFINGRKIDWGFNKR